MWATSPLSRSPSSVNDAGNGVTLQRSPAVAVEGPSSSEPGMCWICRTTMPAHLRCSQSAGTERIGTIAFCPNRSRVPGRSSPQSSRSGPVSGLDTAARRRRGSWAALSAKTCGEGRSHRAVPAWIFLSCGGTREASRAAPRHGGAACPAVRGVGRRGAGSRGGLSGDDGQGVAEAAVDLLDGGQARYRTGEVRIVVVPSPTSPWRFQPRRRPCG